MHIMLFVMLYERVGMLIACVKLLYDCIISLRGEILDRPNSLLEKRIIVKPFICLFSMDVALNIYKGHLIGWSS
jgi:hypothetical protein